MFTQRRHGIPAPVTASVLSLIQQAWSRAVLRRGALQRATATTDSGFDLQAPGEIDLHTRLGGP